MPARTQRIAGPHTGGLADGSFRRAPLSGALRASDPAVQRLAVSGRAGDDGGRSCRADGDRAPAYGRARLPVPAVCRRPCPRCRAPNLLAARLCDGMAKRRDCACDRLSGHRNRLFGRFGSRRGCASAAAQPAPPESAVRRGNAGDGTQQVQHGPLRTGPDCGR